MIETQTSILTVSQLNRQVKSYLENELGIVHVEGEISNLSKPASGHFYFTLKDSGAQIRCVFFKNRHFGSIANKLGDGQHIVASGKLSLYEARGDYQLIVEQVTEAGLGILYQRFEELKNKLAAEGLFHPEKKKTLPQIPQTIGVITSTTGAAIRDILSTLERRYPLAQVRIYPSEVQGAGAAQQLIKALAQANIDKQCDVLIIARGGGSIEDLWAFNDEQLARQIAQSLIPIVSGVGHETDFTITDFIADYRAETPTAAAIAVTPDCQELLKVVNHVLLRLHAAIIRSMQHKKHQLALYQHQLQALNPQTEIKQTKLLLQQITTQLIQQMQNKMKQLNFQLRNQLSTLHAVSPLATLDRGYAIATHKEKILFSSESVAIGDTIEVRLAHGKLYCEVQNNRDSN